MEEAIECITKNYSNFQGRASRSEYWFFTLFILLFYILFLVVKESPYVVWIAPPYFIVLLFLLIPQLSVTVRRLHDSDRSGFWIFISIVPIIGGIWMFILLIIEGTKGTNQYGKDPLTLKR